jgi:DNA-binding MarR family transcriptional regulator
MSTTTNQMSLLDAIGFNAPEDEKPKKDKKSAAPEKSSKPKKRKAKKTAETAASASDVAAVEVTDPEDATGDVPANTSDAAVGNSIETGEKSDGIGTLEIRPDGPLPLDKYLCFSLYSANHAMHGVYKTLLKDVGLTYPQFLAMTVLWDKNNVPVGAITQKLQLDTNTLTPLLKRLEAMGLLTRTRSTKDERQVILKLTRKGRNLQKKTEHFAECIFSSTGLSLEEIVDLQTKIMKLRDNLRNTDLN